MHQFIYAINLNYYINIFNYKNFSNYINVLIVIKFLIIILQLFTYEILNINLNQIQHYISQ